MDRAPDYEEGGLLMALFSTKSYVGIDLGHHTIKVVQLDRHAGGWKVTKSGLIPTPPESLKDGVVVDPVAISQAIRQVIKEAHITATAAHIAVAGASVVVRTVRIPKMPEATLRKSIKFEASRYVPSTVEDNYIEFEIVGFADETQMDVIIVAAPKEVVESRIQACEDAGLEVESVDIEPFAMYRSLIEADLDHDWSSSTIALVDVGSTMTNMSVIQRGAFSMTRAIPNGGHILTEALKSYFKLSEEDAENGKSQLDVTDLLDAEKPKENPPLRVIQPHLDDLVRELRRSLNYYQSQLGDTSEDKQVSLLLLTGGGAKLPGLQTYIEQKLGVKTLALNVFDNPRYSYANPGSAEHAHNLSVASGLAMRTHIKSA
jgi:type IV pilus assembly protein PilM